MTSFVTILIPLALCATLLRLCAAPVRMFWRLGIRALSGFLCLWLLDLISCYTGIFFPLNLATASVAGFLGLPGILLLALIQWIP